MQLILRLVTKAISLSVCLSFSFICFTQPVIKNQLKNGNVLYLNNLSDLYLWADTSTFNPASLVKEGDYNIACYTIIPLQPDNLVQVYGYKQYSANFLTQKQFNAQLVSIFKKRLDEKVSIPFSRNNSINGIFEKYISQFPIEKQKHLREIVDTMFNTENKETRLTQNLELFYQSATSIIPGFVTRVNVPSFDISFTIASFSGCILLRNHPYGLSIILSEDDSSFDQKTKIVKTFIKALEKLNPSK